MSGEIESLRGTIEPEVQFGDRSFAIESGRHDRSRVGARGHRENDNRRADGNRERCAPHSPPPFQIARHGLLYAGGHYWLSPESRALSFASIVNASTGVRLSISISRNSSMARLSTGVNSPSWAVRVVWLLFRARRALPPASGSTCSGL